MNKPERDEMKPYREAFVEHLRALFETLAEDLAPIVARESDPEKISRILTEDMLRRLRAMPEFRDLEAVEKHSNER